MDVADAIRSRTTGQPQLIARIAEVSVDDGTPVPMMCLVAPHGAVIIPTDADDPPVDDGIDHLVHIVVHPAANGGPDWNPAVAQDCRLWMPGPDVAVLAPGADNGDLVRLIVASAVPRSVRTEPAPSHREHRASRWASRRPILTGGVAIASFLAGAIAIRAVDARRLPGRENHSS